MNLLRKLFFASALLLFAGIADARDYKLLSPDGRIQTVVSTDAQLNFKVLHDGNEILSSSPVAIERTDGVVWGDKPTVRKASYSKVDMNISSPFYRASSLTDRYNSLTLRMRGDWSIEFRAYDDGVAYRFVSYSKKPFEIRNEVADFRFPADVVTTVPYVLRGDDGDFNAQYQTSFENTYTVAPLSGMNRERLAFLPLVVDGGDDVSLCFTEVNLRDYPGMYLYNNDGGNHLVANFAPYPKDTYQGGHNNLQVKITGREDYIAKVAGAREFPWRAIVIGNDVEIASSNMTYLLADESRITDTSWIKPGKVAWDWWNNWNISGVDFVAGVNNDTYKHYIDFAASQGIEYVILDEGWAVNKKADLFQVIPEIDLEMLVEHADSKGVGLILWAGYFAFERDMEKVCKHYSEMGIKGFKVDFMDRDDQIMTDFNYRAAEMAAKYHLILDLHGTHKPAGLNRTWPNVLNFEGVHGLEQMKWSEPSVDQMEYDVTIPFIRQVAGPMDYTQGAMLNAVRKNYRPCNSEPMSQGTRCHQLALYVVLESPFNMLCDSPDNYVREPESTQFIAKIPTVWDETIILDGRMGEYVITARRSGETWYLGAITDWNARDIEIDLSFLGEGRYSLASFADGANAHRKGSDYKKSASEVSASDKIKVHMAPGGGYAAILTK